MNPFTFSVLSNTNRFKKLDAYSDSARISLLYESCSFPLLPAAQDVGMAQFAGLLEQPFYEVPFYNILYI